MKDDLPPTGNPDRHKHLQGKTKQELKGMQNRPTGTAPADFGENSIYMHHSQEIVPFTKSEKLEHSAPEEITPYNTTTGKHH